MADEAKWWQFWKWHFHRCTTEFDETGCWGECITCHRRFGFVTRAEIRAYTDMEVEAAIRHGKAEGNHE